MKLRVIKKKNGKYYSEYYSETPRGSSWKSTYKNLNSITQNEFNTFDEAYNECKRFAEENCDGKVVWQDEY